MNDTIEPKGGDDAIQAGLTIREATPEEQVAELAAAAELAESNYIDEILRPLEEMEPPVSGSRLSARLKAIAVAAAGLTDLDRACLESDLTRILKGHKVPKPGDVAKETMKTTPQEAEQGQLTFDPTEPHPEPVDGAVLLDQIADLITRYVILPDGGREAAALWLVHTFLIDSLQITPRLAVLSPTKRCGKSTLLILLSFLAEKALSSSGISSASLYRVMEAFRPTLLADEADTWIRDSEELRGIVNAGFLRKQAGILRCAGDEHEVKVFNSFGAMAVAGIGNLPDTIHDRSVVITMRRRMAGETVKRLRVDRLHLDADPLKAKAARWSQDNADQVAVADPVTPDGLNDRAADCWRPLLAIADLAGGEWPEKARQAALTLSGASESDDEEIGTLLLRDIKGIFDLMDVDRIASADLREELLKLEERPWASYGRSEKEITSNTLGKLIGRFGIQSKAMKISDEFGNKKTKRGYERDNFKEAWSRYISPPEGGERAVTPLLPSNQAASRSNASCNQGPNVTRAEREQTPPLSQGNTVTARTGVSSGEKSEQSCNSNRVRRAI